MAPAPEDSGMGSEVNLPHTNSLVIASFLAIAWYNVAELTVLIHTFFKRRSSFYYYALLVATWGIFLHGLGMCFKFYRITNSNILNTVLAYTGWIMMVTGQSIVLYSRLHLLIQARWIRWVLAMIILNAIVLHTSTGVLTFLTNLSQDSQVWKSEYSVVERVQVTIFFVQELILSAIYIWKTSMMLRAEGPLFNARQNARGGLGRRVLVNTILINVFIICLEITLVALEFSGFYDIQTSYKGAVYSVKLKLEFTILNQLMNLVKGNLGDNSSPSHTTRRATPRSHLRSVTQSATGNKELGNSASAYARMGDPIRTRDIGNTTLQDLKEGEMLKTTTTEVRFETVGKVIDIGSGGRDKSLTSSSSSSSEVYIIDHN